MKTTKTKAMTIEEIAAKYLDIHDLAAQGNDELDFHDLAVWTIRTALEAAFEAGAESRNERA